MTASPVTLDHKVVIAEREFVLPDHPPDAKERAILRHFARKFPETRPMIYERCKEDAKFFINMFGMTFDPREGAEQHDIPFILYDFQEGQIDFMEELIADKRSGIIEKTRDMGVTWVTLAFLVHRWIFDDGFQALIGSRKEDLVDNWTRDSHFGKIQYFIDNLPKWILPKGFDVARHRLKLKLVNPENGNVIIGESANSQFSRQGRYTIIFFDEAAFWDELGSALRAAAQASPTRLLVSTPGGPPETNQFAAERFSDPPRFRILTLHWSLHPHKTPDWYTEQKEQMSDADAAQELDIDYHRSGRGTVYPAMTFVPKGDFYWEKDWAVFTSWDFGISDDTAIIWWARDPITGKLRMIDCYKNNNKPIDFYVPFVIGYIHPDMSDYDYDGVEMEMINDHAHLPKAMHYGDPDVHKRALSDGSSAFAKLAKYGVHIVSNKKLAQNYGERKRRTDLGIKRIEGINWPECAPAYESIAAARFPQRRSMASQSTAEIGKPIHDWTEAFRSAFEFYFCNEPPVIVINRPRPTMTPMAYDRIA